MIKFKEYIQKGTLNSFDIDETLFHTTAKIAVIKDGKVVKELDNQEFNTYKLQPGESYDFHQFRNAEKFYQESKPISKMLAKASAILKNSLKNPNSRMIILTARANFDDKERFLETFRKHNFDIDRVRVERAGNITDINSIGLKKAVIVGNYLKTGAFKKARLFDDGMQNLKDFLRLQKDFPEIQFEAYFVNSDGTIKRIK